MFDSMHNEYMSDCARQNKFRLNVYKKSKVGKIII